MSLCPPPKLADLHACCRAVRRSLGSVIFELALGKKLASVLGPAAMSSVRTIIKDRQQIWKEVHVEESNVQSVLLKLEEYASHSQLIFVELMWGLDHFFHPCRSFLSSDVSCSFAGGWLACGRLPHSLCTHIPLLFFVLHPHSLSPEVKLVILDRLMEKIVLSNVRLLFLDCGSAVLNHLRLRGHQSNLAQPASADGQEDKDGTLCLLPENHPLSR